jgi:hypothetical protein
MSIFNTIITTVNRNGLEGSLIILYLGSDMKRGILKPSLACLLVSLLLLVGLPAFAIDMVKTAKDIDDDISLTVSSSSGSPLVLEFLLNDPSALVKEIHFYFQSNTEHDFSYVITGEEETDSTGNIEVYKGIPYQESGTVHQTSVELVTDHGTVYRDYEIAFTDFQWGRDNLSFANDKAFRNAAGSVSEYALAWAKSRFGEIDDELEFLLMSYMYRLFRENIGICYGFSAAGIYYKTFPSVLETSYATAYEMSEDDLAVVEFVHMLQNDIVYHLFSSGEVSAELKHGPQDIGDIRDEIITWIGQATPIVLGYFGKNTHHSMLVYGYIKDKELNRISFIAANNWNRNQNDPLHSEDTVLIPFYQQDEMLRFDWLEYTYDPMDRLFVIDPRQPIEHSKEVFESILALERDILISEGKYRVIIENLQWAYVDDGAGKKRGYDGLRNWWDMSDITFRRFDHIITFDIPKNRELTLTVGEGIWNPRQKQFAVSNVYVALSKGNELDVFIQRDLSIEVNEKSQFLLTFPIQQLSQRQNTIEHTRSENTSEH